MRENMKRFIALTLAAIFLASVLSSCAIAPTANASLNAHIRVTSSDALDAAAWLDARLGERLTDSVVLGTDADGYGVDVSALESDGYFIRACGDEVALFANAPDGIDRAVRRYDLMVERTKALRFDITAEKLVFVNWTPLRVGYETDLELEAWTKKDIEYSDFSVTKPTRAMPERVAEALAERDAGNKE